VVVKAILFSSAQLAMSSGLWAIAAWSEYLFTGSGLRRWHNLGWWYRRYGLLAARLSNPLGKAVTMD